jgi:hypothetical protein
MLHPVGSNAPLFRMERAVFPKAWMVNRFLFYPFENSKVNQS